MTPYARSVIRRVAYMHKVDPADITRSNRRVPVVRARVAVAKILTRRGYSTGRIGKMLNCDHTTVVFYLGRGKKKPRLTVRPKKAKPPPAKRRWKKPRIAHLKCKGCWMCKPQPKLIRFAGYDPTDRQWITRRRQPQEHRT